MKTTTKLAIAAAAALTSVASAEIISFTVSVPLQATNWSQTIQVPQFDPALGILLNVSLEAQVNVETALRFENLGATGANYSGTVQYAATLLRPDNTILVAVNDSALRDGALDAYDNVTDFAGPSGAIANVAIAPVESSTTEAAADLAAFTGLGTIGLPATATAQSTLSMSSGRAVMGTSTMAGMDVTVTYEYVIPAPAGAALLGLAGLAAFRRRR